MGLIYKAVPQEDLDITVEKIAERICGVPINQLMMQKLMINQAYESMGINQTQMLATFFDGIARHTPEDSILKNELKKKAGKKLLEKEIKELTIGQIINQLIQQDVTHHTSKNCTLKGY